jgi:hypothetical protein
MDFLEGAGEAVRLSLIGLVDVVGVVGNGCLSRDDGEGLGGRGKGVLDPEFPCFGVDEALGLPEGGLRVA